MRFARSAIFILLRGPRRPPCFLRAENLADVPTPRSPRRKTRGEPVPIAGQDNSSDCPVSGTRVTCKIASIMRPVVARPRPRPTTREGALFGGLPGRVSSFPIRSLPWFILPASRQMLRRRTLSRTRRSKIAKRATTSSDDTQVAHTVSRADANSSLAVPAISASEFDEASRCFVRRQRTAHPHVRKFSRIVAPLYSVRSSPRRCNSGVSIRANSSHIKGDIVGVSTNPSQASASNMSCI